MDAAAMRQWMTNDNAVDRRHLVRAVSKIIHRGTSTGEPHIALESCHIVDAERLPMQHLSDSSYYTITNLVLQEGRRHAVRVGGGRGCQAQIGCNNQIEDDVKDVERYCDNCAVQGGIHVTQGPHQK